MFQSFDAPTSPEQGPPRLASLRELLAKRGIDGFIVPRADAHQGEYVSDHDARLSWLTGFISVLLGIGGGSIGVPLMTLHGVPIHRAVATAAGFGGLIAAPSALLFLLTPAEGAPPYTVGSVNMPAFVIVIAMTILTAPIGAALAHRTEPARLKKIFAVFLALVALNMLRKSLF